MYDYLLNNPTALIAIAGSVLAVSISFLAFVQEEKEAFWQIKENHNDEEV